jgi:hypothetical protein
MFMRVLLCISSYLIIYHQLVSVWFAGSTFHKFEQQAPCRRTLCQKWNGSTRYAATLATSSVPRMGRSQARRPS